jgi:hypothetical protein
MFRAIAARVGRALRDEAGQVCGPAAIVTPTAVLGARVVAGNVLPATGVAVGMYVTVAILCLSAGVLMRVWSRRLARSEA